MSAPRIAVVDLAATSRNWALPADGERRIADAASADWGVRFVRAPTTSDGDGGRAPSAEAVAAVSDAEVYFGFGMSPVLFAAAPRLRWVQSAAAGVGAVLYPAMLASDVALTNSAGVHAVPIAEHVVGGVLFLLRSFDVAVEQQRRAVWDKRPFVDDADTTRAPRELGECRVLVVGTGGIGRAVAERLTMLGARCTGLRRRPELGTPPGFARVAGMDALDDELGAADVVVLAAPETPETRGLLDERRLTRLPHGAVVVNVARGTLVDERALAAAAGDGRLRGAVVDVFHEEPLPASSSLWTLPNVLLTPHVSAVSPRRFWARELDLFLDNWARYREGRPLRNLVDKRAGY